ncbi:hypothetical protein COHA_006986 [Chlorella ohadii]|uniref:Glycosyltransferase 61 catalytic domain-containing protein n=1 Tax=Chlorella ohadii TaxID=2649997 RepID=A0AAD5DMY9_9CHLO|nr:hypothetical protein COHA_006986 [Chlorella ohadii]
MSALQSRWRHSSPGMQQQQQRSSQCCRRQQPGSQFEYYLDPAIVGDLPVAHHQVNGAPLDQFPPHLLNLGHAHISQDESMAWRPVVKRQAFPREGPHMRWAPVQQALVTALAPMLTDNFGRVTVQSQHVMYDLLVPLFSMQQLFRVYTPDAQILITAAVKGSREELESGLRKFINTQLPAKSLARLTWNHDAAWVHDYAREVLGGQDQGLVCFKAVVQHIGLQEVPQRQPVITILRKAEGRRRVENSGEVAALLRRRYPAAKVQTVSFDRRPDMTVTEQVKLMSDTSILVTPCGGLATVLTFLRPGAAAIAMNFWHSVQQRSLQLEDNYYSRLEYIDIQYMPVTPEDYAATSDRPGCELVEGGPRPQDAHYPLLGALVHCNLRLAPAGLTRLARYVDAAMLRWAAAHGRYDVLPPPTEPLVVTDGGGSADGSSGSGSASSGSSSSGGHASSGQEAEGQAADALPLAGGEQHADMAPLQQREAEQPSGPGSRQRHRKEGGHAIYER